MARESARLVLLAAFALVLARGDIVSTDEYHCDPQTCRPPECMCASNSPPGGLAPADMPQFVLISHDNALNNNSYGLLNGLLGAKQQRNGCPVPITWFSMRYHSDCGRGRDAMERGDELAMQANRFDPTDPFNATDPSPHYDSRDPVTGKPSVEIEITMSRKWWNEECGLPIRNMVGYRSQNYYSNQPIRQALSKDGYLYDATLVEWSYANSATSPSKDQMLLPYTMDSGIPQDCGFLGPDIGKCAPGENYRGLWEVPLYQLQEGDTMFGFSDYGDTKNGLPAVPDMFALFKQQLDQRRAGGRAPLQLSTFYEWLSIKPANPPADDPLCIYCYRPPSANAQALAKFVDYALQQPDVWFVTYSDLIHWMQNPVSKDQFAASWGASCRVPGIKADLSAVNLTAAQLARGAPIISAPAAAPAPSQAPPSPTPPTQAAPSPAPALTPTPAPSPASPIPSPTPAPVTATTDGAAPSPVPSVQSSASARALATLAAGAAGALAALLLAL